MHPALLFTIILIIASAGILFYYLSVNAPQNKNDKKKQSEKQQIIQRNNLKAISASLWPHAEFVTPPSNTLSTDQDTDDKSPDDDDGMVRKSGYPIMNHFLPEDNGIFHNIEVITDQGWLDLEYTLDELSHLPAGAVELLKVISNPDSRPADIENICSGNAGLIRRILKLVNSPFYGLGTSVNDIGQAVAHLGYDEIRQIIITTSIFSHKDSAHDNINLYELWKHSVATSRITCWLADRTGIQIRASLAGTGAMLHDVGKLVLEKWRPEGFRKSIVSSKEKNLRLLDEELRELGLTHALAGELLLNRWKLPKSLLWIVKGCHQPVINPDMPELALIYTADQVARYWAMGLDCENFIDVIPDEVESLLKFDSSSISDLVSEGFEDLVQDTLADLRTGTVS